MATEGYIPVAAIYSTFLQRAFDQVIHDVAIQDLHVVFALDRGGLVGADGPTHHGAYDLSYLRHIPKMVIMAPADEQELRDMLYTAVEHDGPVAFRYPRGNAIGLPLREEFQRLPIGKAEMRREGDDIAILAVGNMVQHAVKAAELLSHSDISAAVYNMRFIKPLDTELIDALAQRFKYILTVEDNSVVGGFGSAVAEHLTTIADAQCTLRIHGLPDDFIDHGKQEELYRSLNLDPLGLARMAGDMLGITLSATVENIA